MKKNGLKKQRSFRTRIRNLILYTMIPLISCFIVVLLGMFVTINQQYDNILMNLSIASNFNDQFKETLDAKMYQVVTNPDIYEALRPLDDIEDAQKIVDRLKLTTTDDDSRKHLSDIEKYLNSLETNIIKIHENMGYFQNIEILDKRIRVLTTLVQQKMQGYIYNETKLMTETRDQKNAEIGAITAAFGGVFIIAIIIILVLSMRMLEKLTKPLKELSDNFKTVGEGDFSIMPIDSTSNEISVLHGTFGIMVAKIEELMEHVRQEEDNMRRIEFQLLQSQINPHFLYNTFDTIIWLTADGDNEEVIRMVNSLSNFYRVALSEGEDIITLKEEIQHVQSYLEIQQVRYFDILTYEIDVSPELYDYMIPKLSLQPIVENALYHGIKNKHDGGKIQISGSIDKGIITITVRDDGIGMTEETLNKIKYPIEIKSKHGYGLANVAQRMRLYYENEVVFDVDSVYNEYTEVKFIFPAIKQLPNGNGTNQIEKNKPGFEK